MNDFFGANLAAHLVALGIGTAIAYAAAAIWISFEIHRVIP